MAVTMGIDVGTFESKGVLVDDGRILAEARRPHEMLVPRPGWAEHRPEEDWWGAVTHLSRALLAQVPGAQVEALAVSAIGPCCLPVDASGQPLRNGILYGVDTRATVEIAELNDRLGEANILTLAGTALTSQAVGPKVLWLQRHEPEVWAATSRLHTSTSFVLERLTGAFAMDHYTAASWSPLYDMARQDWSAELHGICEAAQLPRLLWSAEIAGHITPEAAQATGLPEGIPVTTGTIDAAAEAVSVGVSRPGDLMLMYGSTVFVIEITPGRVTDPRLWSAPWLFQGQHAAMAGLATSGTLTQWFREVMAPGLPRDTAFETLMGEAEASPPGAKGLLCLPYFSGERTPIHDPQARGVFFGLNLTHTRGDLFRAALEGIAAATRHIAETYAEAGAAPSRVMAVGGGTKMDPWLQATSDMTGLPQELRRVTLGAAYGDAFLAALALGAARPQDIDAWNPPERTVEPRDVPAYAKSYPLFRRLYEQTKDLMHELPA
ncbi:carbohydrate kinase, FGGY [Rubellimicrobium mesophilum DSM 19309]|uniref:Carbohydrate kinase, FGGY n=1 Tax=Rubellimicrobium mesophilum DSM 19309 TaxID=442562 RepID=A0A017HRQ3_9RHOB|nr:FGGY-family carbohydrate kinase [Rubellimicrobium mesophilum]EYD77172.1 carbohydrate kinase, FGGY [Rubellimicrobium mesophilum DSM 19309]